MKIALALEYPLMQQGGTEVLVRELLRGLRPHYEIVLVSRDRDLTELPADLSALIAEHMTWNPAEASVSARQLARELATARVELAHFHFGGTYQWRSNRFWQCPVYHLGRLGVSCLSTNHLAEEWLNCGVNPTRPFWQKHLFQLFALFSRSMVYRRLKVEVCVSKGDQQRVRRQFPWFRHKIIQGYHSLLSANASPQDYSFKAPVVLCVGTMGGRKAQPNLAEAFAKIAAKHLNWQLHFIGRIDSSDYVQRIRNVAIDSGISDRVAILGRLSDEETLSRMQRASIIAMPSLQEGLGLSLQEALFHGCVAVGSRVGGIPELIEHEVNGLLAPPGDITALSDALDRIMSNPVFLQKLRAQTRSSILRKGMTSEAMVRNYLDLYRRYQSAT